MNLLATVWVTALFVLAASAANVNLLLAAPERVAHGTPATVVVALTSTYVSNRTWGAVGDVPAALRVNHTVLVRVRAEGQEGPIDVILVNGVAAVQMNFAVCGVAAITAVVSPTADQFRGLVAPVVAVQVVPQVGSPSPLVLSVPAGFLSSRGGIISVEAGVPSAVVPLLVVDSCGNTVRQITVSENVTCVLLDGNGAALASLAAVVAPTAAATPDNGGAAMGASVVIPPIWVSRFSCQYSLSLSVAGATPAVVAVIVNSFASAASHTLAGFAAAATFKNGTVALSGSLLSASGDSFSLVGNSSAVVTVSYVRKSSDVTTTSFVTATSAFAFHFTPFSLSARGRCVNADNMVLTLGVEVTLFDGSRVTLPTRQIDLVEVVDYPSEIRVGSTPYLWSTSVAVDATALNARIRRAFLAVVSPCENRLLPSTSGATFTVSVGAVVVATLVADSGFAHIENLSLPVLSTLVNSESPEITVVFTPSGSGSPSSITSTFVLVPDRGFDVTLSVFGASPLQFGRTVAVVKPAMMLSLTTRSVAALGVDLMDLQRGGVLANNLSSAELYTGDVTQGVPLASDLGESQSIPFVSGQGIIPLRFRGCANDVPMRLIIVYRGRLYFTGPLEVVNAPQSEAAFVDLLSVASTPASSIAVVARDSCRSLVQDGYSRKTPVLAVTTNVGFKYAIRGFLASSSAGYFCALNTPPLASFAASLQDTFLSVAQGFVAAEGPVVLPVANTTSPPPPGNSSSGGSSPSPVPSTCPVTAQPYFSLDVVPVNCSATQLCHANLCLCVGQPLSYGGRCAPLATNASIDAFQLCRASYLRCVAAAALAVFHANSSAACTSWASSVAMDFEFFNTTANYSSTPFFVSCSAFSCEVETTLFNTSTPINFSLPCADLANLPPPPSPSPLPPPPPPPSASPSPTPDGRNGTNVTVCPVAPSQYLDKIPHSGCPSLTPCLAEFCTCIGTSFNVSRMDCNDYLRPPSVSEASLCLATAVSCVIGEGLHIYVPGAGTDSRDPCVAWSVTVARDYAEWYNAPAAARTNTRLFRTCNATACSVLADLRATSDQISSVCRFTSFTSVPAYRVPDSCSFPCPDGSCSRSIAGCNCTASALVQSANATLMPATVVQGVLDPSKAFSATAYASYRVPNASAPCGDFDFSPFLSYRWTLVNDSSVLLVSANSSTLYIPPYVLPPGRTYTLRLRVAGIGATVFRELSWTFSTPSPKPFVSLQERGAAVTVSSESAFVVRAVVVDKYPVSAPVYQWSCVAVEATCPSLANHTILSLVIAAGSSPGVFIITYTYRNVSSTLNVTITSVPVPMVNIFSSSTPVVATPVIVYLPSQQVVLYCAAAVVASSFSNFTYNWTINQGALPVCTTKVCRINASALLPSTDAQFTVGAPTINTITVEVADASRPLNKGRASVAMAVTPAYSLSLTVQRKGSIATSATALQDTLVFSVSSSILASGAPYQGTTAFYFTYGRGTPLMTVPGDDSGTFEVLAPFVVRTTTLTFTVTLRVNGIVAASSSASFDIAPPASVTAATSTLVSSAASVSDPSQAIVVGAALQEALNASSGNATQATTIATSVIQMFTNSFTDFTSQTTDQVGATLATLATAYSSLRTAAGSDSSVVQNSQAKVLAIVALVVDAQTFDPANGQGTITALSNISPVATATSIATLALKLATDSTLPVGSTKIITSGGLSISTYKQSADALAGSTMEAAGFTIAMPTDLDLGLAVGALAITSATSSNENIFDDAPGTAAPIGGVKSITVVDGSATTVPVVGLVTPICINMGPTGTRCMYRDVVHNVWDTTGVSSTIDASGNLICCTTHFTTFGGFASAASRTVITIASTFVAAFVMLAFAL